MKRLEGRGAGRGLPRPLAPRRAYASANSRTDARRTRTHNNAQHTLDAHSHYVAARPLTLPPGAAPPRGPQNAMQPAAPAAVRRAPRRAAPVEGFHAAFVIRYMSLSSPRGKGKRWRGPRDG